MSSRFRRSRSLFDDFFSDFFGDRPAGGGAGAAAPTQRQVGARRRDRSSSATPRASSCSGPRRRRATWGSLDLDTRSPPARGALSDEVVTTRARTGRTPIRSRSPRRSRTRPRRVEPLEWRPRSRRTPSARSSGRTRRRWELGASYIGPEHVLLSLARDEDAEAGATLRKFGLSHTKLRGLVVRGVDREGTGARERSTQDGRQVQPRPHRARPRGQARPGNRTGRRDRADGRDPLAAHEERPRADRRARRRQDRDRRGHRTADRERRGSRDPRRSGAWSRSTWRG